MPLGAGENLGPGGLVYDDNGAIIVSPDVTVEQHRNGLPTDADGRLVVTEATGERVDGDGRLRVSTSTTGAEMTGGLLAGPDGELIVEEGSIELILNGKPRTITFALAISGLDSPSVTPLAADTVLDSDTALVSGGIPA